MQQQDAPFFKGTKHRISLTWFELRNRHQHRTKGNLHFGLNVEVAAEIHLGLQFSATKSRLLCEKTSWSHHTQTKKTFPERQVRFFLFFFFFFFFFLFFFFVCFVFFYFFFFLLFVIILVIVCIKYEVFFYGGVFFY